MSAHIMVFDSGIGGTTVLEHIQKQLPYARISYFMDNAFLPYGKLNQQKIIERLRGLLHFIEVNSLNVDVLVIACNTASTSALSAIRSLTHIPIVGVVPAIKPAASITNNHHIGLLATPATISSLYTQQLIEDHASSITVSLYSSVALVAIAEHAYLNGVVDTDKLNAELRELSINQGIDVLVLGCTHFPILASAIHAFYQGSIKLLDSGSAIAKRVETVLIEKNYSLNSKVTFDHKKKPLHYYATASIIIDEQPVELVTLTDPTQNEKS